MNEIIVKNSSAEKIEIKIGQILEIINVQGKQIFDFFAFNARDITEFLSPAHSRVALKRIIPKVGDKLVSVYRNPMIEFIDDTSDGMHDMLIPPCDKQRYAMEFGMPDHLNCRTNLYNVMSSYRIPYAYLPDSINFFQNTPVHPEGTIGRGISTARPGDKVVLRALMDIIAVCTSCSQDLNEVNDYKPTDLKIIVKNI